MILRYTITVHPNSMWYVLLKVFTTVACYCNSAKKHKITHFFLSTVGRWNFLFKHVMSQVPCSFSRMIFQLLQQNLQVRLWSNSPSETSKKSSRSWSHICHICWGLDSGQVWLQFPGGDFFFGSRCLEANNRCDLPIRWGRFAKKKALESPQVSRKMSRKI